MHFVHVAAQLFSLCISQWLKYFRFL